MISERQRIRFFVAVFALVFYLVGASFVQSFVTYPVWREIGAQAFTAYYDGLSSRIIRFMVLPGVVEIALTVALLWLRPRAIPVWPIALALVLDGYRFVSTAIIQTGFREQLNDPGLAPAAISAVIHGDYLTQASSIARALLFVWMMWRVVGNGEEAGTRRAIM